MYKTYQQLIRILLVILSSIVVSACESCNNKGNSSFIKKKEEINQDKDLKVQELKDKEAENKAKKNKEEAIKEAEEKAKKDKELKEKQKKIKQEIITTEESYNKFLKTLKDFYLTPLSTEKRFQATPKIKKFAQQVLQLLEPLITISDSLQEDFKGKNSSEITNQELGDIFNKQAPYFWHFKEFVDSFNDILSQYNKLASKNGLFKDFLKEQEIKSGLNRLGFGDYVIAPIQRFPRYKLLLEDLLKNIPIEDPGYTVMQKALDEVNKALILANRDTPEQSSSKKEKKKSGKKSPINFSKKN